MSIKYMIHPLYHECCVAQEAANIVADLWIKAEAGSEAEDLLESVKDYLWDRSDIALEFWQIVDSQEVSF